MEKRIPIAQGNAFQVRLKPVLTDGSVVPTSSLTNVVVSYKAPEATAWTSVTPTTDDDYIYVPFSSSLAIGNYSLKMTAELSGRDVAAVYGDIFTIVPVGMAAPVYSVDGEFIAIGVSDDDTKAYQDALAAAKADYETKATAAEEAKVEYEEKLAATEDIAKESMLENATYGLAALKAAIESGGAAATMPQIQAALDTLKTALQGADADTLKMIYDKVAGIVIPTDYAKKTDIPTDYAKETNATANKEAILAAIPSVPTDYATSAEVAQLDQKIGNLATSDQADNILSFLEADYESQLAEI